MRLSLLPVRVAGRRIQLHDHPVPSYCEKTVAKRKWRAGQRIAIKAEYARLRKRILNVKDFDFLICDFNKYIFPGDLWCGTWDTAQINLSKNLQT